VNSVEYRHRRHMFPVIRGFVLSAIIILSSQDSVTASSVIGHLLTRHSSADHLRDQHSVLTALHQHWRHLFAACQDTQCIRDVLCYLTWLEPMPSMPFSRSLFHTFFSYPPLCWPGGLHSVRRRNVQATKTSYSRTHQAVSKYENCGDLQVTLKVSGHMTICILLDS